MCNSICICKCHPVLCNDSTVPNKWIGHQRFEQYAFYDVQTPHFCMFWSGGTLKYTEWQVQHSYSSFSIGTAQWGKVYSALWYVLIGKHLTSILYWQLQCIDKYLWCGKVYSASWYVLIGKPADKKLNGSGRSLSTMQLSTALHCTMHCTNAQCTAQCNIVSKTWF